MNTEIQNFINKTDRRVTELLRIANYGLNVNQIAEILGIEPHAATMSVSLLSGMGILKQNEPTYSIKQ